VEKIGNRKHQRLEYFPRVDEAFFETSDFFFQLPPFGGVGISLGGLEFALSAGLVLVSPPVEVVEFGLDLGHALLGGDRSVDVDVHATVPATRDDLVAAALEDSGVEHGFREKHNATPAGKARRTAAARSPNGQPAISR
jgi:hypothetical protein